MYTVVSRCQKTFTYHSKDLGLQAGGSGPQFVTLRLQPDIICGSSTGCLLWSAALKLAEFVFSNPKLFKGALATTLPLFSELMLAPTATNQLDYPAMPM